MSSKPLRITLLASEWKSSKGGLSTLNRELAIQLAKHPNVSVSFFVPKCCDEDKRAASRHDVSVIEAKEWPGYKEPVEWLAFPPKDLVIDFVVGHGVVLGKQAQIIRHYHHCKWMQVVHTAPDELAMYKNYSDAISKGDEKQWDELKLCEKADLVVAVGPKLKEFYSAHLSASKKMVYGFTPGTLSELSALNLSSQSDKKFRLLMFGRGDSEDFELKGFDIAAKAVAKLNDKSYHLTFAGASSGSENRIVEELLDQGLCRSQLTVKRYLENRENLKTLLCASNLAIIPSRTEGFGLTALEALSAGLPFLVSQNSGFGEALQEISVRSSVIVDSEDAEQWAEAIKGVREKGSETAIQECRELRTRYANKYSWETQCSELVGIMLSLVHNQTDQPSPNPMNSSTVQHIVRDSAPPTTTSESISRPDYQLEATPEGGTSSSSNSVSSSNSASNPTAIKLESTESVWSPSCYHDAVSQKEPEVKLREAQSLHSSETKQLHVPNEKSVKDQRGQPSQNPLDISNVQQIVRDNSTPPFTTRETITRSDHQQEAKQDGGTSSSGESVSLSNAANNPTDRPSSNPLEFCAVQRIVRNNSAPLATRQMTTRCDQQGVKLKEELSSSTESGSSSSDAKNLTASELKSVGLVPLQDQIPFGDAKLKLKEEQPLDSLKRKQLHDEKPVKESVLSPSCYHDPVSHKEPEVKLREEQPLNSSETKQLLVANEKPIKAIKLESTESVLSPSCYHDPVSHKDPKVKLREEQPLNSSETKQLHVANEKPVKDDNRHDDTDNDAHNENDFLNDLSDNSWNYNEEDESEIDDGDDDDNDNDNGDDDILYRYPDIWSDNKEDNDGNDDADDVGDSDNDNDNDNGDDDMYHYQDIWSDNEEDYDGNDDADDDGDNDNDNGDDDMYHYQDIWSDNGEDYDGNDDSDDDGDDDIDIDTYNDL